MYGISYRRPYENELFHYGIRGQRWGVRRYQNKDGSLTSAGKMRYKNGASSSATTRKPVASFKDGTKTYTKYDDGSVVGYDSATGGYFNVSNEYFEAISGMAEPSVIRDDPIDPKKASKEFNEELSYNSRMNTMTAKDYFKDAPEKKSMVKRIIDKIEDIVDTVSDVAEEAIDAVKGWISGLFSGKKSKSKKSSSSSSANTGPYNFTLENGRTVYKGRG